MSSGGYQSIFVRWWFGHVLLLVMGASVITLAFLMSPGADVVTLFGEPVPMLCSFRRLTGYNCPGCGMTRSFVFLAHGQIIEAFRMNPAGPPMFVFMASLVPWQGSILYRGWQRRRAQVAA